MKRLWIVSLAMLGILVATAVFAAPVPASKPAAAAKPAPAAVDSLTLLERDVARDSTRFEKVNALGVMYMDRERMQDALTVLGRANRLQPGNVKVLVNMGIAADALGHPEEAQGYYQKAMGLAPADSIASCHMASSLYAQGKYEPAMTLLRSILAKQPRAYCAYFYMGVAFADAGIYRDAIRMWKKVVEIAPESSDATSARESIDVLEKFLQNK